MSAAAVSVGLMAVICVVSGLGGMTLKLAAHHNSLPSLALSLIIYSVASVLLFTLYRQSDHGFITTTVTALLGTMLVTHLIGLALGETLNARAVAVLFLSIVAFVWAIQPGSTSNSDTNPTPQIESEAT